MYCKLVGYLAAGTALAMASPAAAVPPVGVVAPGPSRPAATDPFVARTLSPSLGRGPALAPESRRMRTRPFKLVAVTWRGDPAREFHLRTRSPHDGWTGWRTVHPLHEDGPDPETPEARTTQLNGSDLVWAGESNGVQVRAPGGRPDGLELVLIDPGADLAGPTSQQPASAENAVGDPGAGSTAATAVFSTATAARTATVTSDGSVPRPAIRSRRAWGADESLRDGSPTYNGAMKQGHIHHTAGSNRYGRGDVAGIIRGMYWYHTQSLGWSDIGYNFLVDKFGRIWVGRAGGPRRNVRGAHTLGFNHQSFGVAAIGTFENSTPTRRLVRGLVRLSTWKLALAGRRPAAEVWTTSFGSDRYPARTKVRLPVLDGHRDTNHTACPGEQLYDRLPRIRKRAQARFDRFS